MAIARHTVDLFADTLHLSFAEAGAGRCFLLLHGGAGPASMYGLAESLSAKARAVVPIHPGFNGEPRPERFGRIDDLVLAYLSLIERLDLRDVVLVGNSVGGWIAAEMALRLSPRLAGAVLINSVGIDAGTPELSIVDPTAVQPAERAALAFHNPEKFAFAASTPEAAAAMVENQKALRAYAGEPFMHEPTLLSRLAKMPIPTLVIWGESDRIVRPDYGRVLASSISHARFAPVAAAGHFPQIERLEEVERLISDFVGRL
ncbi:alpha/beta fold hydrolase [Bradyrhizobium sp. LTSP885]|uniref:alpha/beta fold hydrolase n=1 Tax=Bradyrhizobium sp. LTSP885 TaxID=1619232 RepID=UPI0006993FEC|nr:alpha/beta fold hydrolase [Bradyrhizobium sp. LTSP885]